MRAETAQFHAVVAQVLQLVQDDVKIERRLLLVEDVRPTADGEFLGHRYTPRVSKDGVRSPHRDTHDPTQRREDSQRKSANTNASREARETRFGEIARKSCLNFPAFLVIPASSCLPVV